MLKEIAQHEGWTLKPVRCDWHACLDALQAGFELAAAKQVALGCTQRR